MTDNMEKIQEKLDVMTKLLAIISCQGRITVKKQIKVLMSVGLKPIQIAEILERSPNLIRVLKHNIEKEVKR